MCRYSMDWNLKSQGRLSLAHKLWWGCLYLQSNASRLTSTDNWVCHKRKCDLKMMLLGDEARSDHQRNIFLMNYSQVTHTHTLLRNLMISLGSTFTPDAAIDPRPILPVHWRDFKGVNGAPPFTNLNQISKAASEITEGYIKIVIVARAGRGWRLCSYIPQPSQSSGQGKEAAIKNKQVTAFCSASMQSLQ